MRVRQTTAALLAWSMLTALVWGQTPALEWHSAERLASGEQPAANSASSNSNVANPNVASAAAPANLPAAPAAAPGERATIARVSKGSGTLPNDHGQVWREYDISPYTLRVTSTKRPEQAIIDWILRDTGYEAWHGEVTSVLTADARTLRVYHTVEMQNTVSEIVDRFVNSEAESQTFNMRVVTIGSPNWRAHVQTMLQPIPVQSQGTQAWLMNKEDAALLMDFLRKRNDFREYTSPHLIVHNGQSSVVGASRPHRYAKGVLMRPNQLPGFELEVGQIDEGYSLEFIPLMSVDGRSIEAVVKANINQIEKMIPVTVEIPTPDAAHQRQRIEIPQMMSSDLHERFRWPVDQVLLISRGVVATPVPSGTGNPFAIKLPGAPTASRADALVFIENKGKATAVAPPAAGAASGAPLTSSVPNSQYQGRY